MLQSAQGIPDLPDITHPQELIKLGAQFLSTFLTLAILVGGLGIALALLNFSLRRDEPSQAIFISEWVFRYSTLLRILQHAALVLILLVGGFFLCSTLGNRYHNWEQQRVEKVASQVAGEKLEQPAPQVRYVVEEPYTYTTQVDGKLVRVKDTREVNRLLAQASSVLQVNIEQTTNLQTERASYLVDFSGEYQVANRLNESRQFFFEVPTPIGYSLLKNFQVERDGTKLQPINPGDYGFPFRLTPGEETRFRVTYQAEGGSRWVYNANGQLLSNFRLTVLANFPGADFASGIKPTESNPEGRGTRFTWVFDNNVSVQNPFGVFTATTSVRNTGILPRLLLLAPALFLWWLLLLYLSLRLNLRDVALAGGIFFASLLALTYLSRIVNPPIVWTGISLVLLFLAWGMGLNRRASLAAVICTIAGAVLPVLGLLVPYSGLTLSLAGFLSVLWLAVYNWYGWYNIEPNPPMNYPAEVSEDVVDSEPPPSEG